MSGRETDMDNRFLHGGDMRGLADEFGVEASDILDFSANINPYGPPAGWRAAAMAALERPERYPDPKCRDLRRIIAARYESSPDRIVVANGASEGLDAVARALCRDRPDRPGVVPVPCYSDYPAACLKARAGSGHQPVRVPLPPDRGFALDMKRLLASAPENAFAVIGRPNNPTGAAPGADSIAAAARARPDVDFIVDESFLDFLPGAVSVARMGLDNIVSVRSLTKFYSIPALRIGFVDASPDTALRIAAEQSGWPVNAVAMRVAEHALSDDVFAGESRTRIAGDRERLSLRLRDIPELEVFPGEANFLLLRLKRSSAIDGHALARRLLVERRIAVRTFAEQECLDRSYFRIAVRTEEENDRLAAAIREILTP